MNSRNLFAPKFKFSLIVNRNKKINNDTVPSLSCGNENYKNEQYNEINSNFQEENILLLMIYKMCSYEDAYYSLQKTNGNLINAIAFCD